MKDSKSKTSELQNTVEVSQPYTTKKIYKFVPKKFDIEKFEMSKITDIFF